MNGRGRGWGRGRCRRRGWGRGRRGRGRKWGDFEDRRGWEVGSGIMQVISKPVSAIKRLLVKPEVVEKAHEIYSLLPKRDCGSCGFDNCYQCALAIASGEAPPDACKVVGRKIRDKVEEILKK